MLVRPNGRDGKVFETEVLRFRGAHASPMLGMSPSAGAGTLAILPKRAHASPHLQSRAQRRHRNHRNAIWSNVAVTAWRDHTEHTRFTGQCHINLRRKLQ